MSVSIRHLRPRSGSAERRRATAPHGFSLVEAMVSAGIVGVMLVASVNLLSSAARTRVSDSNRRTGALLAQQLVCEIVTQPYKDESPLALLFGPEVGEAARTSYDDVDDYNNYIEKPPKDFNGVPIAAYEGWERRVSVDWVTPDTLNTSLLDSGLVRVEVTVTDPRGAATRAWALRAERAVPADPPPAGTSWVQFTDIELEVGGDPPRHVITGSNAIARPAAN